MGVLKTERTLRLTLQLCIPSDSPPQTEISTSIHTARRYGRPGRDAFRSSLGAVRGISKVRVAPVGYVHATGRVDSNRRVTTGARQQTTDPCRVVDGVCLPLSRRIGCVLEGVVGVIRVANVDLPAAIGGNRGQRSHIALAIDRRGHPRAGGICSVLEVVVGGIPVANVDFSGAIGGNRGRCSHITLAIDRRGHPSTGGIGGIAEIKGRVICKIGDVYTARSIDR